MVFERKNRTFEPMRMLLTANSAKGTTAFDENERGDERARMIDQQIVARGVKDERVLAAMRSVPRHWFTPLELADYAYQDTPLSIGMGQTISQPYIVAFMTEQLQLTSTERVLEIGAGCGYQTVILSQLAREVIAIEIVECLARDTAERLQDMAVSNVTLLVGDGSRGYLPGAPYEAILIAAATPNHLHALTNQLAPGGRLIAPISTGGDTQELTLIQRGADGELHPKRLLPVRFVPMTGGG